MTYTTAKTYSDYKAEWCFPWHTLCTASETSNKFGRNLIRKLGITSSEDGAGAADNFSSIENKDSACIKHIAMVYMQQYHANLHMIKINTFVMELVSLPRSAPWGVHWISERSI